MFKPDVPVTYIEANRGILASCERNADLGQESGATDRTWNTLLKEKMSFMLISSRRTCYQFPPSNGRDSLRRYLNCLKLCPKICAVHENSVQLYFL